jgi:ketosteroid isomerase-like protein
MSENENIALVKKVYGLFSSGDIHGLLSQFADDITWETPGAPRVPYAGRFRGRDDVAKFFEGLGKTAEFDRFEPREFIAQADRVVVLRYYSGKGRITGRPFGTNWAMVFTVQRDKVTGFHEFFDTENLGGAFT